MVRYLSLLLAIVAVLCAPVAAKADFTLVLASGGETATVDLTSGLIAYAGGATASADPISVITGAGQATVLNAKLNNYVIQAVLAQSNSPGLQTGATLGLTGVNVVRSSSTGDVVSGNALNNGALSISLTATGYTSPNPQKTLSTTYSASFMPTATIAGLGMVTESSYYDASNTPFGTGGQGSNASSSSGGAAIGGVTIPTALPGGSGTFSMTNKISISGMGVGNDYALASASVSSAVYAPAPSGLILAATIVPFFGILRRRMRQTDTPVVA
jgi:hypothetical protein